MQHVEKFAPFDADPSLPSTARLMLCPPPPPPLLHAADKLVKPSMMPRSSSLAQRSIDKETGIDKSRPARAHLGGQASGLPPSSCSPLGAPRSADLSPCSESQPYPSRRHGNASILLAHIGLLVHVHLSREAGRQACGSALQTVRLDLLTLPFGPSSSFLRTSNRRSRPGSPRTHAQLSDVAARAL